jgi:hypothetical protein
MAPLRLSGDITMLVHHVTVSPRRTEPMISERQEEIGKKSKAYSLKERSQSGNRHW